MNAFSVLLATTRANRSWSLRDVAERSGVATATVAQVERGNVSVSAVDAARLAAALGLSLAETTRSLIGYALQPAPAPVVTQADAAQFTALADHLPGQALDLITDLLTSLVTQRATAPTPFPAAEVLAQILAPDHTLPTRLILAYPRMSGAAIRRITLAGGALLAEDVHAYATTLTPLAGGHAARRAAETLARLRDGAPFSHLKLFSVLELDRHLGPLAGIFFGCAWQLLANPPPATWALLTLARWHELTSGAVSEDWLIGLRTALRRWPDLAAPPMA